MSKFNLIPVKEKDKNIFITEIQKAFQYGYEMVYGSSKEIILPTNDIENSFNANGSKSYFALLNDDIVGGVVVVINEKTQHNHLDLLFTKVDCQSKGVGLKIWNTIEKLYPKTKVWETHTPYFEKRNIHFYVNKCGFHIVEFFNPFHKDLNQKDEQVGGMSNEVGNYFFRFEKIIR